MRVLVTLLVATTALLTACAPTAPAPTGAPPPKAAATAPGAKPAAAKAEGPAASPAAKAAPQKVKFGHIPGIPVPIYLGVEKGYFAEQSIDLEMVPFTSPAAMIPPLATGELDIAQPSIVPGFYNALARGISLRIAADATHTDPNGDDQWVVVGAPNKDKITDIRDLKGKKIAVTTIPNIQVIQIDKLLAIVGLKLEDVTLEAIGAPDTLAALQSGAVDAAHLYGGFTPAALQQGIAVKLANTNRVIPDYQTSIIGFSDQFATQRNDAGKRFMVAYLRAVREVQDAREKGTNRQAVLDIVGKAAGLQPQQVVILPTRRDGRIHLDSIVDQMNWYRDHRALEGTPPDIAKFVDYQFVEAAVQQLSSASQAY